jgi:hypothetical protein
MKKLISLFILFLTSCYSPPSTLELPGVSCDFTKYSLQPADYLGQAVKQGSYLCPSGATVTAFLSRSGLVSIRSDDPDVFTTYLDYSLSCKHMPEMLSTHAHLSESGYASSYYCADRNSFLVLVSSSSILLVEEFWQPAKVFQ